MVRHERGRSARGPAAAQRSDRLSFRTRNCRAPWSWDVAPFPGLLTARRLPRPPRRAQRKRASWRPAERAALRRWLLAFGVGRWKEVRCRRPTAPRPPPIHTQRAPRRRPLAALWPLFPGRPIATAFRCHRHLKPHLLPPSKPRRQIHGALADTLRSLPHGAGDVEDACWEVVADAWGALSEVSGSRSANAGF